MIQINGYLIDAFLTESHDFNSEVSSYPVEKGADITDNIRPLPITVTVSGIVSDTPIGQIATTRGDVNENGEFLILPSGDAYAFLMEIREKREPVTIETSLKVFENMALQSLSVPRDAATGKALRFTATFVQLQLVTNERTTVRVALPRASKKQNKGNKSAEKAPDQAPPPNEKDEFSLNKSVLRRITGN